MSSVYWWQPALCLFKRSPLAVVKWHSLGGQRKNAPGRSAQECANASLPSVQSHHWEERSQNIPLAVQMTKAAVFLQRESLGRSSPIRKGPAQEAWGYCGAGPKGPFDQVLCVLLKTVVKCKQVETESRHGWGFIVVGTVNILICLLHMGQELSYLIR